MTRHQMREAVFILVFESLFSDKSAEELLLEAQENEFIRLSDEVCALFTGIMSKTGELDDLIKPHLKKWTISRISRVSLSVLRLAIYELVESKDIDPPVVINEAVELTKEYSVTEDASFVNGVLGSYIRALEEKTE